MIPDDDVDAPTAAEQADFFADRDTHDGPSWDDAHPWPGHATKAPDLHRLLNAARSGWGKLTVGEARAHGLTPDKLTAWGYVVDDVVAR